MILAELLGSIAVASWHAQAAHINVRGENFYGDHKLLGKIYEYLQESQDTAGEVMQTRRQPVPTMLMDLATMSHIIDSPLPNERDQLLRHVYSDLMDLKQVYADVAEQEPAHIKNWAEEQIFKIEKFCWMLRSTIEEEEAEDDSYSSPSETSMDGISSFSM